MAADSEQETPAAEQKAPNLILIVTGFVLLGAAAVLILFGSDLFGQEAPEVGVLDQVPQLSAGTLASTVSSSGGEAPAIGDTAPDFTLENLEGNRVSLSGLRGKPVIVNFWASWCGPCRIEMPELEEAYEARREQGLEILAINREEPPEVVRNFFYDELDLTFTPLLDTEAAVANRYQVFNLPTTFFIDKMGTITAVHRGPLTENQIASYLGD